MITLTGDPLNLQGGSNPQLTGNPQQTANPQQTYGPTQPPAPTPTYSAPKPVATTTAPTFNLPVAHPDQEINSIFSPYIGSRPSPSNPGVLEYYNLQTGQGFSSIPELFNYASSLGAGQITSFGQLHAPVTTGSYQGSGQNYQPATDPGADLAGNAGTAGLSVDDYMKLISGQNQLTPDEIAQIRGGLGIDQLEQQVFQPPAQNTVDLYNTAYGAAGLADLKKQITDTITNINDLNSKYTDKVGTINENPFLSEASRTGRLRILTDQRDAQIGNLQTGLKNYQDLYQNGLNEVNGLVQRSTNDFTQTQSLNAQKLQYLLSKAEQQGAATLASKTQAAYKYLPDYLKAKAKATAPTTFSAGNGASYYFDKNSGTFVQLSPASANADVNPITGDVFSKNTGQPIGGSGGSISIPSGTLAFQNNNPGNLRYVGQPGATQGAGGFARFNSPEEGLAAYQAQVQLDASRGLTLSQFISKYAPPTENNTSQYLQQAVAALGVSADTPLSQIDPNALAQFQLKKESGTTFSQNSSNNVVQTLAEQLLNGQAAPSQVKDRKEYGAAVALANSLSLQRYGKPFDTQAADINYQNDQAIRPILNNEASANAHLDTLEQLSNQLSRSSNAIINEATLNFNKLTGDSLTNRYFQALSDAQSEIAKVLAGNGQVTDDVRRQAEGFLNPYLGPEALSEAIAQAKTLMHQKVVAYTAQRNGDGQTTGLQMPSGYPASGADLSDLNFSF